MTFDELYDSLPGDGWLSKAEATLLYQSVQLTTGPILEVGVYHGKSTCLLASLNRPMYCVDPFVDFNDTDPGGDRAYTAFIRNVCARGRFVFEPPDLRDRITPPDQSPIYLFKQRIEDWKVRSVGFAYLDGDHTAIGTERQCRIALEADAKVIGVHDFSNSGGGREIQEGAMKILGEPTERAEKLAVWIR